MQVPRGIEAHELQEENAHEEDYQADHIYEGVALDVVVKVIRVGGYLELNSSYMYGIAP